MSIDGLRIIGESINDSVPSTTKLFEAGDIDGIKALARAQDEGGATYIDVNVGQRSGDLLAEMVKHVQSATSKPLAIDTPDPAMSEVGLKAYDPAKANGAKPIINSISPLRTEMFDLLKIQPFVPLLLATERDEGGKPMPNHTTEETYQTACQMRQMAADRGIGNEDMIFDPGIAPIGSDAEGNLHRLMATIELMHNDPDFKGCHMSVGLSNFTVMIPPKRPDGMAVKSTLESAFLTRAFPLGMDTVIGSVKRKYQILPEDHPALLCFDDVLKLSDFECIMRVQEFYSG